MKPCINIWTTASRRIGGHSISCGELSRRVYWQSSNGYHSTVVLGPYVPTVSCDHTNRALNSANNHYRRCNNDNYRMQSIRSIRRMSTTRQVTSNWLVQQKGVDPKLVDDILSSFPNPNPSVSDLKQLGNEGLHQLVNAVIRERKTRKEHSKKHVQIHVIPPRTTGQTTVAIDAVEGDTLQSLVERDSILAEYMECTCSGIAACGTCHVYVDKEHLKLLPEPEEAELDILDLVMHRTELSRLGCQIHITKEMKDITFTVPDEVLDLH
jgi:ferredoxin